MSYIGLGADTVAATAATQEAETLARQLDPTGGRKYRFVKGAMLYTSQAIAALQQTQVGQAILKGGAVADTVADIVSKAQKGEFKADASGMINIATAATQFVSTSTAFLSQLNVNSAVLEEISSWTGVGAACAGGFATMGPFGGAAACGLIALGKIFSYLDFSPEYVADWTQPRTLFMPNEVSVGHIALDAVRLAQVLRSYYGVSSYRTLQNRLVGPREFSALLEPLYPSRPAINAQGKVVAGDQKPLPGHNLRTALHMFSFGTPSMEALENVRNGLAFLAAWRHGENSFEVRATGLDPAGRGLYHRFEDDQDISADVIANGAYVGRSAIAAQRDSRAQLTVTNCGDLDGWPRRPLLTVGPHTFVVDMQPFIVADELINFFAAVTAQELAVSRTQTINSRRGDVVLIENYGFGIANPTRHLYVRDTNRSGEPAEEGGPKAQGYGPHCWTNLARPVETCQDLASALYNNWQPADRYLRAAGSIRLMAALSFLHQQYIWSSGIAEARVDPIAQVQSLGLVDGNGPVDPLAQMREPLDPRQSIGSGTTRTLTDNEKLGLTLAQYPLQRSRAIARSLTGGGLTGAPTFADPYAPARTNAAYLVQQIAVKEAWLREAREAALKAAVAAGKTVIASPTLSLVSPAFKATPTGWQLAPTTFQALATAAQKKSMAGPLLLGAAALLAFKFLK